MWKREGQNPEFVYPNFVGGVVLQYLLKMNLTPIPLFSTQLPNLTKPNLI